MGQDKALIQLDGESLLSRQARVLHAAGAMEVLVNQHPDRARPRPCLPPGTRTVWDDPAHLDDGPLAGLAAVLAEARSEWVAVAAVDVPGLSARWWQTLLAWASPGVGVVGRRPDGVFEPLAAIYPRGALSVVHQRLNSGERVLQDLARVGVEAGWLRAWAIPRSELETVRNWNRPEDQIPPRTRPVGGGILEVHG